MFSDAEDLLCSVGLVFYLPRYERFPTLLLVLIVAC